MTTPPSDPSCDEARKVRRRAAKEKYRKTHQAEIKAYQERTKDAAKERIRRFWVKNPEKKLTYWREYQQRNRERIRDRNRRKLYGISSAEWDALFALQGHRCAICETTEPGGIGSWHGDHNHKTGQFRGILCNVCNVMLGHAKDEVAILHRAAAYLIDPPYKGP